MFQTIGELRRIIRDYDLEDDDPVIIWDEHHDKFRGNFSLTFETISLKYHTITTERPLEEEMEYPDVQPALVITPHYT